MKEKSMNKLYEILIDSDHPDHLKARRYINDNKQHEIKLFHNDPHQHFVVYGYSSDRRLAVVWEEYENSKTGEKFDSDGCYELIRLRDMLQYAADKQAQLLACGEL